MQLQPTQPLPQTSFDTLAAEIETCQYLSGVSAPRLCMIHVGPAHVNSLVGATVEVFAATAT